MRKTLFTCLLGAFALQAAAQVTPLDGFAYSDIVQAPTGKEWENPEQLSLNKEQPHAWFFSFADTESARRVLPENSTYWKSLNGEWRFHWVGNPDERPLDFMKPDFDDSGWARVQVPMNWNVVGIQPDGSQKWGTPIYSNQRVIFQHTVKVDDWRGGVMRTPPTHWPTYKHRNEVGSYRRTFTIPAGWQGREIYLNFDGVDSFFYLYINGRYVGFSKNSRNVASFDITPYLVEGENVLAAEVYRNSDGSFLESQDMFRLPGIFRTVSLTAKPKLQVRDLVAKPELDATYTNGSLNITAYVRNLGAKKVKKHTLTYTLYANDLYSDTNHKVEGVSANLPIVELKPGQEQAFNITLQAGTVKPWSAEAPWCYVLVGELKDKKGNVVETFSTVVGFREVEIKETAAQDDEFKKAGRYYYLNGKPIKMKGVNRHETNPERGHAITREQMHREVMLMKQGNINHVRNSHYCCDPYWYYLCNKYGIYLEDEANIESHQYYYGKESLSHPAEWRAAHVARNMEMVHANVNHPSIVIWSLGNEAGPGNNFVAAYDSIKTFDTTRPVQYERNNNIVDMGSNQYPSVGGVKFLSEGGKGAKYPFHISEYAHSMGNAVGNLAEMWQYIESSNFVMGGAIWDWVDQAIYNYDPKTGDRYLGYGGDFGDNPNDGTFCMNGIMQPNLEPKAQYFEVKKVYQNVGVKAVDMKQGRIEIFNKNYFEPFNDYEIRWTLFKNGQPVLKDQPLQGPRIVLQPRMKQNYVLPYNYAELDADGEYYATVQFVLNADKPWAKKGYVQMEEQLLVKKAAPAPAISAVAEGGKLKRTMQGEMTIIEGDGFKAVFDNRTGSLHSLTYGTQEVILPGHGPQLDAFRAPTDNDIWIYRQWVAKGLHNLKHKATDWNWMQRKDGAYVLTYAVESQAPNAAKLNGGGMARGYRVEELPNQLFGASDFKFVTSQIWTIYKDGSIELQSAITSNSPKFVLPRIGYSLQLPKSLDNYTYYGRGPENNYNDRCTGSFVGLYNGKVKDQGRILPKPQAMGNREEVRWCALTDAAGNGVEFVSPQMSASALPWSEQEIMLADHPYQLPQSSATHLHLDAKVTGLGGNSCGQGAPLDRDRAWAGSYNFSFIIRPVKAGNAGTQAYVAPAGDKPILVSRANNGDVTLSTADAGRAMVYSVNNGKPVDYTAPFALRDGGKLKVWYKDNKMLSSTYAFEKIESIPLEVVFCSSQEYGEGNASHLTDGDNGTIWHTMYSVTVANYPHWVNFDAGSVKQIKGFVYTPRLGGGNGDIKDYEIYLSMDGENWGEPVKKGTFAKNSDAKTVRFDKPIKARYIQFRALSEQNGADFASGAEFSILAD